MIKRKKYRENYEYKQTLHNSYEADKNSQWKGGNVGYISLHAWVRRRLAKPVACPSCGLEKRLDLANISNEYKRELSDWEWLCRRCHMIKDGRMKNLKVGCERKLKDIRCLGCGGVFHPPCRKSIFCSKACRGYVQFKKTISRFTKKQLKDIKDLPYPQVYKKYNITQRVVYKIKNDFLLKLPNQPGT